MKTIPLHLLQPVPTNFHVSYSPQWHIANTTQSKKCFHLQVNLFATDFIGLRNKMVGASLVVRWLSPPGNAGDGSSIPDPGISHMLQAAKPMFCKYEASALESKSPNYWICMLQLLKPMCLEPVIPQERSQHNEKLVHHSYRQACVQQRRPITVNKWINKSLKKTRTHTSFKEVTYLAWSIFNTASWCEVTSVMSDSLWPNGP